MKHNIPRTQQILVRLLLLLVVVLGGQAMLQGTAGASPLTANGVDALDFSQCANSPDPSLACPDGWINGDLNRNKSHYAEDQVVPQRLLADLEAGGSLTNRTITIQYMARKQDIHAYDSLATWNYTQTAADRCQDLRSGECVGGAPSTFPIPDDPTLVPPASNICRACAR